MEIWRLLISPADGGSKNLATDQAISEQVRDGASLPTLRFYSWNHPTLSLGYAQPISLVDVGLATRLKIQIVRRSTGGLRPLRPTRSLFVLARRARMNLQQAITRCLGAHKRVSEGLCCNTVAFRSPIIQRSMTSLVNRDRLHGRGLETS